jgi:sodium transport system ATP-binding protein
MIVVDQLGKTFAAKGKAAAVKAVDGVSLTARDGEITGILGPNGAGKTTLLRMLATLIVPDTGHATVNGLDVVTQRDAVRRQIGVLSDSRGLYPRLTARENIAYFGRLHGVPAATLDARVGALLATLNLSSLAERRVQGFSQGEKMKVAIARALVHDPQVVMLDEPTNGLDIMSVRALREQLRALRDQGKCLVFSSHVMQEVAALCNRIVIMGDGHVVASGTTAELVAQSGAATLEDAFVALLGSGEGLAA